MTSTLRIAVAGATGWVGRSLVPAILQAEDLILVGAVSRSARGRAVAEALGVASAHRGAGVVISGSVAEALKTPTDVLVDFTHPDAVGANAHVAIDRGVHVVVGTSGLTDADYTALDAAARAHGVGVLAAGNFAITAVLLMRFAELAARYVPSWEIIEYADAAKVDAPGGTVRELLHRLANVRAPTIGLPLSRTLGEPAARGATMSGTQVHSVRLPGYTISVDVQFGMPDERLSIRHDSGSSAAPYVAGVLLAVRAVPRLVGVHRGLDSVMDGV